MISSASFRTTRLQAWSECVNSNHCMRPTTLTASSSMSMKKKKINAAYTSNLETIPEDINYSFSSTSNGTSNSRFAPNPRKAELEAEEEESTEPTSVSSLTLSMDGIGNQKLETKMLLSTSSTSVTNSNSRCSTLNNKPLGLKPYPIKSTAIELTSFPTHPSLYTSLSDPRPLHVSSLLKKNQSLLNTIMNALEPGIQQDTFNTILYTCRKKMPDLPWVHRLATFLYDVPPILNAFLHLIGWVGKEVSSIAVDLIG
ncbi:hypothetical protein HMI56_003866 [Coelomomyces lativittatus]|nr:hypothetical protein HMI56_003866 [Coelomomyces lativittatus]